MKKSEQIEQNRQWYEERGIDVDMLIQKQKELESATPLVEKIQKDA